MRLFKHYLSIFFAAMLIVSCSEKSNDDTKNTATIDNNKPDQVKVIYFHGTKRCHTCNKIERLSEETIRDEFAEGLSSGKISWETIDFDLKENEHYLKDYNLVNQALIMIKMKDGKQIEWKDCPKVWQYYDDQEKFSGYVKKELTDYQG